MTIDVWRDFYGLNKVFNDYFTLHCSDLAARAAPLQLRTKISGENGKKIHLYHHLLIIPSSPYINVEFQVFHLTLTLNTDGEGRGRGCHLCYNYQF